MKYLVNNSNNPGYNLAFEEYCFKNLPKNQDYISLWINSPSVLIGRNQNTLKEINEDFVKENKIGVFRRITGGGAVYNDFGNINFTIITEDTNDGRIDFIFHNQIILKALIELGLRVEFNGRNDILLKNKKISGIAQSTLARRVLNHGTLMYDVNIDDLEKVLYVSKDKLKSKGIDSVRNRVTNIRDHLECNLEIDKFKDIFLETVFELKEKDMEEYKLNENQLIEIDKLYKKKYKNWDWNFGQSPKGEYKNRKKFNSGLVEIEFNIVNGKIENAKICGDFFNNISTIGLEELLNGSKYIKEEIEEKLKEININNYLYGVSSEDFLKLIF